MVGCQDDAAQHKAQHDEQGTLRDHTGDLVGQVEACGGSRSQGASLAPQRGPELGKQGPPPGAVATSLLPLLVWLGGPASPPGPGTPSSEVSLPPAQKTAPFRRESHARVRLEGLHDCFDRGQVSRARAPTPQAPQTPSDLTPLLYLVPWTPTLPEALLCLHGSAPMQDIPPAPQEDSL